MKQLKNSVGTLRSRRRKNAIILELSEAREYLKYSSGMCVEYADRVNFLEKELASMEKGNDLVLDEMKISYALTKWSK